MNTISMMLVFALAAWSFGLYGPELSMGFTRQAKVGYDFTTLDVPSSNLTSARAINDSGRIVGYYEAGGVTHGFVLSEGNYVALDVPGSTSTNARAINNSGQIGGDYEAGGMRH